MKNTKLLLLSCLMTLIGWNATAQRVIAYHQPSNNDKILDWYWEYISDINYSFLQVSSAGQVGLGLNGVPASDFEQGLWDDFLADANKYGKRVNISVGGASKTQAQNFKTAASTDAKAAAFAKNLVKWTNDRGLNGIDVDWEPEGSVGAPTAAEWIRLLSALRTEINNVNPNMELTAAVFPYKWNNTFITEPSYQYVDHLNLMVYDFGGDDYPHHSNTIPALDDLYGGKNVEEACVSYWSTTKKLDKTKMVLGLPFYARSKNWAYTQADYKLYRDVLALGGSATADQQGNWMYNGQTSIKRKTKYMMDNGLKGVMMWEIAGDATSKDKSLLAAIEEQIGGECQKPNLGNEQNICGKESIELDASLAASDYSFKWQKDGKSVFGGTNKTYAADGPGTYKVIATKIGTTCSRESAVIITGDYPEVNVLDVPLCGEGDEIEVDATIEGFENMDYKWTGPQTANTAKIAVSKTGTYTVEVSDPYDHCETKSKSIEASESTVPTEGGSVCQAGDEAHVKVIGGGTGYSWWDAETGGTLLGSESELFKTITKNTTFYVQKTGGAVSYTAGLSYDHADVADDFSGPGNGDYEWAPEDFDDLRLYFVAQQSLTIDQITAHLDVGFGDTYAPDIKVCLYDGEGKELECKDLLADNGKNDLALGFNIEPGNYYIGIPTTKNWGEKGKEDSPIDYDALGIDGILTLNSTVSKNTENFQYAIKHWYAGFYDIKISTGKPCPRVAVEAVIDDSQPECIKYEPTITVTKPGDGLTYKLGENFELAAEAIDKDSEIKSVDFVLTLVGQGDLDYTPNNGFNDNEYVRTINGDELPAGNYIFTATVKTMDGQTAEDKVEFTISGGDVEKQAPSVSITSPSNNSSFDVDTEIDITASANDADGSVGAVGYVIKLGSKTVSSLSGSGSDYSASFTPDEAGTYTITATATDNDNLTGTDEITFTVKEGDVVIKTPPTVSITSPSNNASFDVDTEIDITASADDTDGVVGAVGYVVKLGSKTVASLGGSGSNYSASFTPDEAGTYTITATATDNDNLTGTDEITVTVVGVVENIDPVITIVEPANTSVKLPNDVNFDITATDTDGSIASVTIAISGGENVSVSNSGSSYTGTWSPDAKGTYTATITATDDQGATVTKTLSLTVLDANENLPPTIVVKSPITESVTVLVNEVVDIEANITDDGSISSVTIDGETVNGSGDTYTSSYSSSTPTTQSIDIVATDDKGVTTTKTIQIIVKAENTAPNVVINNPKDGETITLTNNNKTIDISATVNDDDAVSSVVIKVNNQTVNTTNSGNNYTASYTPNGSGNVTIEVTATDNEGETTTESVTVSVEDNINSDAVISINKPTASDNISTDDNAVAIDITSTDSEGVQDVKVEVINNETNSTSTVNTSTSSNGKTTGTWNPTEEGSYTIQVTVTDDKGNPTTKTMTIQVNGANELPVITLNDLETGGSVITSSVLVGTSIDFSATVSHNGDDIETIFYHISQVNTAYPLSKFTRIGKESDDYATSWVVNGPGTFEIVATAVDPDDKTKEATSETKTLVVTVTDGLAEENAAKLNFVVAPNPAVDQANVSFELIEGNETVVSIYNAQGQIISTVVNDELVAGTHAVEIDVNDLPSGIYFIQLVTGDTLAVQRLIVE